MNYPCQALIVASSCRDFDAALGGFGRLDIPGSRSSKTRTFLARFSERTQGSSRRRAFPSSNFRPLSSLTKGVAQSSRLWVNRASGRIARRTLAAGRCRNLRQPKPLADSGVHAKDSGPRRRPARPLVPTHPAEIKPGIPTASEKSASAPLPIFLCSRDYTAISFRAGLSAT